MNILSYHSKHTDLAAETTGNKALCMSHGLFNTFQILTLMQI